MPRRSILTKRQQSRLLDLPADAASLHEHYTLDDFDLEQIRGRRRAHNKMGFTLQLCALRYPGRLLASGETIPFEVLEFLADQIEIDVDALAGYASREETRRDHLMILRSVYGFKAFTGRGAAELRQWLQDQAFHSPSNLDLAERFIGRCRETQTILPGVSTIERICAEMLVNAERRIDATIAAKLDPKMRGRLDVLLDDMVTDQLTRFVWLRQFEVGNNSRTANQLLDRLERLQKMGLPADILDGLPSHKIKRLRRHGERYFASDLRELSDDKRYAIMAVCMIRWHAAISDAVVETHDRIVGRTWREAKRMADAKIEAAQASVKDTLLSFKSIGASLLAAHNDDQSLEQAIEWSDLEDLVATAGKLTGTLTADPIGHVTCGLGRFQRYAARMLRVLEIEAAPVCQPLLKATHLIRDKVAGHVCPTGFLRPKSKWHVHLRTGNPKLWDVAVLFQIRDAFRSRDMWLRHSEKYTDLANTLVPVSALSMSARLTVSQDVDVWLTQKKEEMATALKALGRAAKQGLLPHASVEAGELKIDRLPPSVPDGADQLVLDIYAALPEIRITDLMLEVDADIGFTDAFTNFRTGAVCKDKLGLMNVLLAEGLNLGLSKMAGASNSHGYWQLQRISQWHIVSDAINRALAAVIDAQADLPMAHIWGLGETASSDGQFFPTTRQGEAMNLINAKYSNDPGIKAYTHVSDQFGPFATQKIPATVSEAPYILDGLLTNDAGKRVKEQYADTGGFTDHTFALSSLLGFAFVPRIRDLPSKRLYVFDPATVPKNLRGLMGGKVRENVIRENWTDILRVAVTMETGAMPPSQIMRTLASYPRQNALAVALREIGRIERTLFIARWLTDSDLQRRAQIGLNKGEAHHALKNALRIGRQGEIRDRSSQAQEYRIAGLNLLAAIIIYWNTRQLGKVIAKRRTAGVYDPEGLLCHVSPLGWGHVLITGEYRWPKNVLKIP
jgi:TnpA family transposase